MWVGIGKCLIFVQIRHMVRLFVFYCEYTVIRKKFEKKICVSAVFFAIIYYFAIVHLVNSATFI
jgi:hypothetical protein